MSGFTSNDQQLNDQSQLGGQSMGGQTQQPTGEKQDWLDKGIEAAGKKFGFNVVRPFCCTGHTVRDGR